MMICEKCGNEIPEGVMTCRPCGHNQVLERIDAWRERRTKRVTDASGVDTQGLSVETAVAARSAVDGALIQFPNPQSYMAEDSVLPENSSDLPLWKQRLNQRLREIRESKTGEGAQKPEAPGKTPTLKSGANATAGGGNGAVDPRVEAALNRIKKADYYSQVPPITPTPGRRSSLAKKAVTVEEPHQMSIDEKRIQALNTVTSKSGTRKSGLSRPSETVDSRTAVVEVATVPEVIATAELASVDAAGIPASIPEGFAEVFEEMEAEAERGMVLEAASLRMRLAAAVIDAEVIALSFLPLFAVFAFFGGRFQFTATTLYVMACIAVCLMTVYFFLTYTLAGRTIGMGLVKLHLASQSPMDDHISSDSPSTVTFTIGQAFARTIGGVITLLFFPINVLFLTRSYDRLSISDYLSNTQIVRIRK